MKAYVATEAGPYLTEVDRPFPRPDDVVIRVAACALNRADLAMARGAMRGRGGDSAVLGLEWAGEVVEAGAGVTGFQPGDRVMGSGGGAFAEYAVADVGRVLPIPDQSMSFEQAAALPVALQTMHDAVITNGRLQAGQAVLVQGASSGVGLMAMQIAKRRGARLVIGSSTDSVRRGRLAEFGADAAIDSRDPAWVDDVLRTTDRAGVDLVIDQISGYVASANMRATRLGGRIVNVGRLGGMRSEFDLDLHALRRITYIGVTFRTRSKDEVREITRRLVEDLWDDVASGALSLPIDRVLPFDHLPAALDLMAANGHFGKIVVRL